MEDFLLHHLPVVVVRPWRAPSDKSLGSLSLVINIFDRDMVAHAVTMELVASLPQLDDECEDQSQTCYAPPRSQTLPSEDENPCTSCFLLDGGASQGVYARSGRLRPMIEHAPTLKAVTLPRDPTLLHARG